MAPDTRYEENDLRVAAQAAIRAPSLDNSQPWLFRLRDGGIDVLAGSPGWAARIACGAAVLNARLALAVAGRPARVTLRPHDADADVLAHLSPGGPRPPSYLERDLFAAIPRRHSNRRPFHPAPVPSEIRVRLIEAADAEGCRLDLLIGPTALRAFAELAGSADRVLRRNLGYQEEFAAWTHRGFEPEPLVGVLSAAGDWPTDQVQAGQALQRVLLTVTDAGLACSMMSQPIEVPAARDRLRRSLSRRGVPQMTLRIGYGVAGPPTERRPVEEVLAEQVLVEEGPVPEGTKVPPGAVSRP
jgi:hypothetical protein